MGRRNARKINPRASQDIDCEDRDASAGSDTGECLLRTRFAVGEAIAANDNCDQRCDLGDGSSEKSLKGCEARIERRT